MITVTEIRSQFTCNNDSREKTIVVKFLGIIIYKKSMSHVI